jgi:hypothetical protein
LITAFQMPKKSFPLQFLDYRRVAGTQRNRCAFSSAR